VKPKSFMVIAGEASGDLLAAELVQALRRELAEAEPSPSTDLQPLTTGLEPRFFGAGGPRLAAAGLEMAFDLTAHSVIGLSDAVKRYLTFHRLFRSLLRLAQERQPDVIICVDFSVFNTRFAHAIKRYVRTRQDWFHDWAPKVVRYVSPQVWASRENRAYQMERDCDLLLSIFPFEKEWYAKRVPRLRVEFVGHPMVDRYGEAGGTKGEGRAPGSTPTVLLLPGSRSGELRRHLPVLAQAARLIAARQDVVFRMVLPQQSLVEYARPFQNQIPRLELQVGGLEEALGMADVALTKSGTITLECAYFGVPAVVFYKTSLATYLVGKQVVRVQHLAMPNLLAGETVYPEFVQGAATGENLARATLALLEDKARHAEVRAKLARIVASLGPPGASRRAARAIASLLNGTAPT
jgi:lipid-A-disaccharide synthase